MTNIISRYRHTFKQMKDDKVIANSFAAVERVDANLQDVFLSICSEVSNIDKKELVGASKTFAYFIAAFITVPIAILLVAYHVITFCLLPRQ